MCFFITSLNQIMEVKRNTKMQLLLSLLIMCLLHVHPTLSGGYLLSEYRALLSIKSSITDDPQSALSTWNTSTSHCTWSGITCHPSRRRVTILDLSDLRLSGTLSPDLAHLRFLSNLCVASNQLSGAIPAELSSLSALRVLNLSDNRFNGRFPSQLSLLKNLQVLDLYDNDLTGDLPLAVTQMPNLRHLHLGRNFFSGGIPSQFGQWKFLEYLDVSNNELGGPIPQEIGNLTNLRELYIGQYPNMYEGGIPPEIGNLSELVRFEANGCLNLSSEIPPEIGNLVSLKSLDLSYNVFTGEIPESIGDMPELEELRLWENNFTGIIPQRLGKNGKLQLLYLSSNKLTGTLPPDMCFGNRLELLYTDGNLLSGPIPDSLGRCESLSVIRMEHNFLNGSMPRDLFGLPNLTHVLLRNNRLTGKFPISSRNVSQLRTLDISDNKIHGELPSWIWRLPDLQILNLSHNCLETLDVNLNSSQTSVSRLRIIDLHSNQLQGQLSTLTLNFQNIIPRGQPFSFFISRNKFDGTIPMSLCNATYLGALDLSHNHLTGTIPQCLIEMSTRLSMMDLGGNNLTGVIPDSFSDYPCYLQILVLNGNQLEGELPKSLAKCNKYLKVLDVGNNRIQDTFPCYLKSIDTLRVLILRANQFYGSINCLDANTTWSNLQILDLASNHFVGKFPIRDFSSWKGMIVTKNNAGQPGLRHSESSNNGKALPLPDYSSEIRVNLTLKGQELELVKVLTIYTSLDLSCNSFDGHIPAEIGEFKALYALNLSHNAFTGKIPQALGNVTALESLDLSSNKLIGEIPQQLADGLIFLSTLNLSFNQLVGKIPQNNQFTTFTESSFEGNIQLCDFPMKEKCIHEELGPSPPPSKESHWNSIDWDFLSVELGFVFGFGIFIGPLIFWKRWRKRYYKHVDDIVFKMFPRTYIRIENHRRRAYTNQGRQARRNQGGRD
ncbi:hypothetical protein F2P56_019134 [Juglans regia]|uniref:Uncharacterized protein n=1 Tax=Juglans regia TaxID=51240 RepID=A0A833XB47_JUGRE|nr:hypothetical protein F2P56_019134 [Juglans regia]